MLNPRIEANSSVNKPRFMKSRSDACLDRYSGSEESDFSAAHSPLISPKQKPFLRMDNDDYLVDIHGEVSFSHNSLNLSQLSDQKLPRTSVRSPRKNRFRAKMLQSSPTALIEISRSPQTPLEAPFGSVPEASQFLAVPNDALVDSDFLRSSKSRQFRRERDKRNKERIELHRCKTLSFLGDSDGSVHTDLFEDDMVSPSERLIQFKEFYSILVRQDLTEIPDTEFDKVQLHHLDISENNISSISDRISQLTSLSSLKLDCNRLTDLPSSFTSLGITLTKLNLRRNDFVTIPSVVFTLGALQTLDLSQNYIESLPDGIVQLSNLTTLRLDDNRLSSISPALANVTKLTLLNLSNNQITEMPSLVALCELRSLYLTANRLTTLVQLKAPGTLTSLFLSDNNLTSIDSLDQYLLSDLQIARNQLTSLPSSLQFLRHLKSLDASSNLISSIPRQLLHLKLESLELSSNPITSLPEGRGCWPVLETIYVTNSELRRWPAGLCQMPNLRALHLSHSKLEELPDAIGQLVQLNELVLDHNLLQYLPESVGKLVNLHVLVVTNNALVQLPDSLGSCKQLIELSADDNRLTSLPKSIASCQSLRILSVINNDIVSVPAEVGYCLLLKTLNLDNNPLLSPPTTIACLGTLACLNYLRSQLPDVGLWDINGSVGDTIDIQTLQTMSFMTSVIGAPKAWQCDQEIELDQIKLVRKVGNGFFGEVWLARFQDEPVAVKFFTSTAETDQQYLDFCREVSYLRKIRDSPYIVKFIGASTSKERPCIVTEFVEGGSLRDVLDKLDSPLSLAQFIGYAMDIAYGIYHLHTCFHTPVLHRDLSSRNLLVTKELRIKVADFGMSRFASTPSPSPDQPLRAPPPTSVRLRPSFTLGVRHAPGAFDVLRDHADNGSEDDSSDGHGDVTSPAEFSMYEGGYTVFPDSAQTFLFFTHAAPEVMVGEPHTIKSDVFAYGVVLWELLTRAVPYMGLTPEQIVNLVVSSNARLELPEDAPDWIGELIRRCWDNSPLVRPNFQEILAILEEQRNRLSGRLRF